MSTNTETRAASLEDQTSLTHSYFLLGMLFEKIRNDTLYTQVHPIFFLYNAYSLQSEYSTPPEILNIWKYLVGIKISSLKEQKKLQELFCIIAAMQDLGQGQHNISYTHIEKYFSMYLSKDMGIFQNISFSLKKDTNDVVINSILSDINDLLDTNKALQKYSLITRLFTNLAISANGLLPYPYLNIDISEENAHVHNKSITKALEKCMRQFDMLKTIHSTHLKRISTLGRVTQSAMKLYSYLLKKPVITTKDVQRILGIAKPNALLMIDRFIEIGILCQLSIGERNRIYGIYDLLKIFDLHEIK